MSKALVIGAGNIGRGFLAEILSDSGYQITFCDVNAGILDAIALRKSYEISYVGTNQRREISNFRTVNSATDQPGYEQAVSEASLIMTAIGANLLPRISRQLAEAINKSPQRRVLMACENAIRASSQWKVEMDKYLADEAKGVSVFVDVAVDRIVPNIRNENGDVSVEPYKEMVVDKNVDTNLAHLKGVKVATTGLDPYISRKLFCVNATHAYVAWLGIGAGFTYVHEAISHPPIAAAAKGLLNELTGVLHEGYGLPVEETRDYGAKVLLRFNNAALQDTLERVGRGVLRKISPNERFVAPLKVALENNLPREHLLKALRVAGTTLVPNDPESAALIEEVKKIGLSKALANHTGLGEEVTRLV